MIASSPTISNIIVIGCGGVASWLLPPLTKLIDQLEHKPLIWFVDGDTIEERNLERQWFSESDIGRNKAEAMWDKCNSSSEEFYVPQYYTEGALLRAAEDQTIVPEGLSLFICCADNHAARRAVLAAVDAGQGWAIIAGNEYEEAEAYWYERRLKGTACDPRVYYPAILTDHTGDPTAPVGCTGLAAELSPQLVLANFSAANHALWLFWHHVVIRHQQGHDYNPQYMPIKNWNYSCKFLSQNAEQLNTKE